MSAAYNVRPIRAFAAAGCCRAGALLSNNKATTKREPPVPLLTLRRAEKEKRPGRKRTRPHHQNSMPRVHWANGPPFPVVRPLLSDRRPGLLATISKRIASQRGTTLERRAWDGPTARLVNTLPLAGKWRPARKRAHNDRLPGRRGAIQPARHLDADCRDVHGSAGSAAPRSAGGKRGERGGTQTPDGLRKWVKTNINALLLLHAPGSRAQGKYLNVITPGLGNK